MKSFLSCDWGVSSFRLRYVPMSATQFDSVESPDKGIAATFGTWNQSGRAEEKRFPFFRNVIADHIRLLEGKLKASLEGIPVVVSGMASSSIGMIEIPYKKLPFKADGSDLQVMKIKRSKEFGHDLLIISGARTNNDVMRGEETQLAGCNESSGRKKLYIFPGTHSKHILVKKGSAISFKTYMTGEFFDLLSKKSILSSSLRIGAGFTGTNKKAFDRGVIEAQRSNLLHSSFLVRTNQILKKWEPGKNYYYLSGLLIGAELSDCVMNESIILVASGELRKLYTSALKTVGLKENTMFIESTVALVQGQLFILKNFNQ